MTLLAPTFRNSWCRGQPRSVHRKKVQMIKFSSFREIVDLNGIPDDAEILIKLKCDFFYSEAPFLCKKKLLNKKYCLAEILLYHILYKTNINMRHTAGDELPFLPHNNFEKRSKSEFASQCGNYVQKEPWGCVHSKKTTSATHRTCFSYIKGRPKRKNLYLRCLIRVFESILVF